MTPRRDVAAVFARLRRRYGAPSGECDDPFRVLVGTILSQRTNDDVTYPAVVRLFARYPTVHDLAGAKPSVVERLIKPVGFYRTKAPAVVRVAREILDRFGGRVPRDEDDLLSLPHVGRKTMNCVLVYGFGRPAIAVDTHVHRISNRLGWVETKTPEETEEALRPLLTKRQAFEINELLVRLGRDVCRPVGPLCGDCALPDRCPSARDIPPRGVLPRETETMLSRISTATSPE